MQAGERCQNCRHWGTIISGSSSESFKVQCDSPHVTANGDNNDRAGAIVVAFGESGVARGLWTGPDFGCVHWEAKD